MKLPEPLFEGKLIARYKRFLVDVALSESHIVTAHCPNSGSMMGLLQPGSVALLSASSNPNRKLLFTWELVKVKDSWVGVNTINPNRLIYESLQNAAIPELAEYREIKKEVLWQSGCRFDFMLGDGSRRCFVEVKNVTLARENVARFPDAVTVRGTKHLRHLMEVVSRGHRAVMLFLVNRSDCDRFQPAADIDSVYAETLREALDNGVEMLVYRARSEPPAIELDGRLL
ncbi:DNA/RNA nuclease SfsA [bacterium]|nr:DNA/RNA nuclease SfsA [bacterium]